MDITRIPPPLPKCPYFSRYAAKALALRNDKWAFSQMYLPLRSDKRACFLVSRPRTREMRRLLEVALSNLKGYGIDGFFTPGGVF